MYLIVCAGLMFGSGIVHAEQSESQPEEVLKNAYEALVQQDIESYAENVYDLNYSDDATALEAYKLLSAENELVRYEIIETVSSEVDRVTYVVEEEYASGFTVQSAMHVEKFIDGWKVFISDETTSEDAAYGEVIKPSRIEQTKTSEVEPYNGVIWKSFSAKINNWIKTADYGNLFQGDRF